MCRVRWRRRRRLRWLRLCVIAYCRLRNNKHISYVVFMSSTCSTIIVSHWITRQKWQDIFLIFAISLDFICYFRVVSISTLTYFHNNDHSSHIIKIVDIIWRWVRTSCIICQITNKQSSPLSHYTHVRSLACLLLSLRLLRIIY